MSTRQRPRGRGGRPPKLTPELQQKICNAVAVGVLVETAAKSAGIHNITLWRWLRDGNRAVSGVKKEFCNALQKAMADAETAMLTTIANHAKGYVATTSKTTVRKKLDSAGNAVESVSETTQEQAWKRDWTAAAWWLERKYPDTYGRRDRVDVNVREGEDEKLRESLEAIDPSERASLHEMMAKVFANGRNGNGNGRVKQIEAKVTGENSGEH